MFTSPNMSLKVWNLGTDVYDHTQLAQNMAAIDAHDHTFGKGAPISTAAIANGAITRAKLAPGVAPFLDVATVVTASNNATYNALPGYMNIYQGPAYDQPATVNLPPPGSVATGTCIGIGVDSGNVWVTSGGSPNLQFLGVPNQYAKYMPMFGYTSITLQTDGAIWRQVAGQSDTGIRNLVLNSTFCVNAAFTSSPPPCARKVGSQTYLNGVIEFVTGSATLPAHTSFATLPLLAPIDSGSARFLASNAAVVFLTAQVANGGSGIGAAGRTWTYLSIDTVGNFSLDFDFTQGAGVVYLSLDTLVLQSPQ